jgi:hypothetical protein
MPSQIENEEFDANAVGPPLTLQRSSPFTRQELEAMGTESPSEYSNTQISSRTNEQIPSVGKPSSIKRGKNGGKKSRTRRNKKRQNRRKSNKRYSRRR